MDKKYICPCGLICTDCLFYKPEIYQTAKKLRDNIKESQLDVFLTSLSDGKSWKKIADHLNGEQSDFEKYFEAFINLKNFMNTLEGLINLQCKTPCRKSGGCSVGGKLHKCEAVICVKSKGYKGCWECPERNQCEKLSFVKKAYGDTVSNTFKNMRSEGAEGVKSYGHNYYAWQQTTKED
jgi:hypothetical protein